MDNICKPPSGDTTGGTTGNSTTGTTDGTTGDTGVDTTGDTAGDATSDSTGRTTGDTTGDTTGNTTGDVDPGCDGVPEDMACIPANTFEMGSDLDNFNNAPIDPWEKPAHTVTVSSTFWIDLTEVTVEAYALCWAAQVCALPKQGQLLNWGVAGKEKHPANGVHWYQAKQYCEWKGKRLPTEAEWELAARGVDGRMYPWGNEIPTCDHVHGNECAPDGTGEVATKPMGDSPHGVHDMAGNVAEWTSDYYKADYYYESPQVDPKGPVTGTTRSVRSIGVFVYKSDTGLQRATYRVGWSPLGDNTNPAVMGFRCAQTPP